MAMDLTSLTPQQGIGNDQLFADDVGSLLEAVEGKKPRLYLDDRGIPSVGIGINLHLFAIAYLKELGISGAERAALREVFKHTYLTQAKGSNGRLIFDSIGNPVIVPDFATFNTKLATAIAP